ncbi:MAG: hypothetical protein M1814_003507 [Vezdaea aestivalis]|nr:MAG: hypothetical protein M1814_003507 [Vezdaea aestivalis]
MTTAVATAMPAPLPPTVDDHSLSPKSYPNMSSVPQPDRSPNTLALSTTPSNVALSAASSERSPRGSIAGSSPTSERKHRPAGNRSSQVIIKKEAPSSPSDLPNARRRPTKLNLKSNDATGTGPRTGGPRTGRDMHDVGLACLSPGFSTQDPAMREHLQRSISVRDQQRHIIESRLNKYAKGDGPLESGAKSGDGHAAHFSASMRSGASTSRKKAPPGLHIVPPSAEQFANERVIMSAPLGQTFTGRHQPPLSRHTNQPSNLSNTSHIHNVPSALSQNRLPPISDVFAQEGVGHRESNLRNGYALPSSGHPAHTSHSNSGSSHSNHRPQFPSPGSKYSREPPTAPLTRPREFRTSEEAVAAMSGGREELVPKLVHYGGHQPPTPPSPLPGSAAAQHHPRADSHRSSLQNGLDARGGLTPGQGRRRTRAEYEGDNSSPPLGTQRRDEVRRPPFDEMGSGQFETLTSKKKEKFMSLISEAWDVLHS